MTKSVLIAGLPDSGKSTFIAALWSCLDEKFDNMKLSLDKLPNNSEYLNSLSTNWNDLKKIDHTSIDRPEINIPMKINETGEIIDLYIPDYKGETFKGLILNRSTKALKEHINKNTYLLYFISECNHGSFIDDIDTDDCIDSEVSLDEFNIDGKLMSDATPDTLNMLVLRWLNQTRPFDKIIICISAWDKKADHKTAKEYVKETSPGLYNFIIYHFPNAEFLGVSAQGCEYGSENIEDFAQKTLDGERAFVVENGEPKFDISLPIYKLIME